MPLQCLGDWNLFFIFYDFANCSVNASFRRCGAAGGGRLVSIKLAQHLENLTNCTVRFVLLELTKCNHLVGKTTKNICYVLGKLQSYLGSHQKLPFLIARVIFYLKISWIILKLIVDSEQILCLCFPRRPSRLEKIRHNSVETFKWFLGSSERQKLS